MDRREKHQNSPNGKKPAMGRAPAPINAHERKPPTGSQALPRLGELCKLDFNRSVSKGRRMDTPLAEAAKSETVDLSAMLAVGDIPRYRTRHRPDALALSFEGRQTSFDRFDLHTNRVARRYRPKALKKSDRIAYVCKNNDLFLICIGAAKMGAVVTPIGWRMAPPEISYINSRRPCAACLYWPEVIACALEVSSARAEA